ncbi:MAG: HlyD family efflux transporter periplasmic adaptor subunit, partial [Paludibacter sp.]|nr:HlyD family efflux transporter periplasmic adaptor subunit [Paludibacter sp.]
QTGVRTINASKPDVAQQIAVVQEQIEKAITEKTRLQNLLNDGAATQKQLDDVDAQLKVLQRTLAAQKNQLNTGISSLTGEGNVRKIQIAQIEDLLRKSHIISPIDGTVLEKYVEQSEVVAPGVPIFKIADTKNMFLRAYIVADQLNKIKIGDTATVFANNSDRTQRSYKGRIAWISDKAEFTPKTIQTQNERQNLVYAVKISVENTDGLLKIGMYGDVDF